jgi:glycosyltransferase involved in cell wall biosynthesis
VVPVASIIIPAYNKEKFISETIESVLAQTYPDFELIIVDDCSQDKTAAIAGNYLERSQKIRLLVTAKNSGANYCRNLALKNAAGKYVVFLDADDLLGKDCISTRIKKMESKPGLDFGVFSMGVFKTKPGDTSGDWVADSKDVLRDFVRHRIPWSIVQPMWKRDFLLKTGGFDESFERLQDVEFHTRVLLMHNPEFYLFGGVPDCFYRISDERRNFGSFEYNRRRIGAVIKYYRKFLPALRAANIRTNILGPVFESYHQLIYHLRTGQLSSAEFESLERKLLDTEVFTSLRASSLFLFRIFRFYNLRLPRVPGVNRVFNKIIVR